MSISLSKLEKFFYVDKLIIHSLDLALYQASVVVDGKAQFITDDNGIFLRAPYRDAKEVQEYQSK